MNGIFGDLIGICLTVYIDDVQIYTRTFEEHLERLEEVFRRLEQNGLYLKPKKCTFIAREMKYLGFVINQQGLNADPVGSA